MDSLPSEVHAKIASFLCLNDLAHLRLVSQSIKQSVDTFLKSTTHLQVVDLTFGSEVEPSYIREIFYCKKFLELPVKGKNGPHHLPHSLFTFLGTFCPNLQVFDAGDLHILYDDLLQVAQNLVYFTCWSFDLMPNFEPEVLFVTFPKLQAYDEFSYSSRFLNEHLLIQGRPVLKIHNSLKDELSSSKYEQMVKSGAKCLRMDHYTHESLHPICQNLASNLIDLSIRYLPPKDFFRFPLPNLKYLKIDTSWGKVSDLNSYKEPLLSSPKLKSLIFEGSMSVDQLHKLLDHLHPLENLTDLQLELKQDEEELEVTPKFVLPVNLQRLTLYADVPHEIFLEKPNLLVSFKSRGLSDLDFTFVNLDELTIFLDKDPLPLVLLDSIRGSSKLRSLRVQWSENGPPLACHVMSLLHVAESIASLRCLQLITSTTLTVDATGPVVIKHENLAHVRQFVYALEAKTQFHPSDLFKSLEIDSVGIAFVNHSEKIYYQTLGFKFFSFSFDGPIDRLTKITLGPVNRLKESFFSQIKSLKSVKDVQFRCSNFESTLYVQFIEWISSLESLKRVNGHFDGENLQQFLTRAKTNGPLEIQIPPNKDQNSPPEKLSDDLHSLIISLKEQNVLKNFVTSLWFCGCSKCPLQVMQVEDLSDDSDDFDSDEFTDSGESYDSDLSFD